MERLSIRRSLYQPVMHGITQKEHGNATLLRNRLKYRKQITIQHQRRNTRFQNACFLSGNRLTGRSQFPRMIQIDRCDNRQHRENNIGGIQSPAHPCFHNGNIHLLLCKILKR